MSILGNRYIIIKMDQYWPKTADLNTVVSRKQE